MLRVSSNVNKTINICICGSGNIAHALVGYLGKKNNHNINILSSNNFTWRKITVFQNDKVSSIGKVDIVTNDASRIIPQSDIIIFTVPLYTLDK